MTANILTIGDELLIGQVIDTNSAKIAKLLQNIGITIHSKLTVADSMEDILYGLNQMSKHSDLIIITGGLGPTKDDITKYAFAKFFNVDLSFHHETYDRIEKEFMRRNIPVRESHRQQCFLPENAHILKNNLGTAPGMWFEHDGKIFISMPGVPFEMIHIMEDRVIPKLSLLSQTEEFHAETISTLGIGETEIAHRIEVLLEGMPEWISLSYLPAIASVRIRLTGKSHKHNQVTQTVKRYADIVYREMQHDTFSRTDQKIEQVIGTLLLEHKFMLATAESCTGGFIAQKIVSVPGSSSYFAGSVVAYSYELKENLLGVSPSTLIEKGAVSEETVQEMLFGLLHATQAHVGIAVSGIAGPDGGTVDKPVGTVWIAVGTKDKVKTKQFLFSKDRERNIEYSAVNAMVMLYHFLKLK